MAQHRSSASKDLVITCIKGDGRFLKFWALPISGLDTVKNFEAHFANLKSELDSSCGFSRSEQIPINLKCVVKSEIKNDRWCRAGIIAHQGYNSVLVRLLDYGNVELIPVSDVRSIDDSVMAIPPQAIECILADVMPIRNEWSIDAISFCEQHLRYNTLSCYVVSEYMKVPIVRVAKKGESEPFVQRLINGGLALIKRENQSPPPQSLSYKMNTMDPNTSHLIRVSCIENAHKFYVQLSAAENELKHLMDTINRSPNESYGPLKSFAANTPCLAQLSTKPCYYRALITFIQQTRCKVFFVDYGFSEMKDIQELRAIPPTFLQLSAQAICCSLPRDANINPEEFKNLVGFDYLELLVLSRTTESYIVKLLRRGTDVLLAPQIPQKYIQQKITLGVKCEVNVSYVNDLTEFYCQLTQLKEQQDIIANILNSGCNFLPISMNECEPGKPTCVKFSEDNHWYRARIMKVNHESDIEVFFVDFGNYDNVSLSDVRKIGPDLLKFPVQAFKCFLFETPVPADSKARDDAFDLLEELTSDQCLLAHVNTFAEDAGYGITLYMKNSTLSVNEKLTTQFISISSVSVDDIENVYVTTFDSPGSFFVQFEKLDSEKLALMQDEINAFYSGTQNNSFVPKEGNLVCARFNDDDQYYRAKVEKCKDEYFEVYFIDYGNRESISIKDVHFMDAKFTKYPQFGVECAFEKCPTSVPSDKLSGLILENSVQLKMIRKENDKWYVSLTENFPGNVAILELLRQFDTPVPRSIHGAGLSGYQEKPIRQESKGNSWNNGDSRHSQLPARIEINKVFNAEIHKKEPIMESESTEEYENYSLVSIPLMAYRNVYVSHVISPSEFYCQIEEDSSKLQLLMKTIEDTYSAENDNLNMTNFTVDTPCCAMFEDGIWYRGQIKNVNVDSCDILFVDYGNTSLICKSKIKKINNDLIRLSSHAVSCKSFNISPKCNDWNDNEIDAFIDMTLDKSFVAQFVECDTNHCYSVNLCSIGKLQDNIFNKEFVDLGYGRLQDSKKSLVLNSHAASANLSFDLPNVEIGSSEAVQVPYGLNPCEIFCQLKSYEQEFMQMMINLQKYYNSIPETESLIDRPHQGMICVAQFFLDSAWYRAVIKKVETNKVVVLYVDYGNSETVDRKKIRCIIQEYTSLPIQAIKCRIRGIKPPGKSWTVNNNLGKYFEGKAFCKFTAKEGDTYIVDITCNQTDVSQLLISDGLALSDLITQSKDMKKMDAKLSKLDEIVLPEVTKSLPALEVLPKREDFVNGQLLSVDVSFTESPSKFWCQLSDDSHILDEIKSDINSYLVSCPSASVPLLKVGSFCIVEYSEDNTWYRAQIKSCQPENTYDVFFIDYGNSEIVSLSKIKMLLPELLKYPPHCFECCLHNTSSKLLSDDLIDAFFDILDSAKEITAKIEHINFGICTVTLLYDKDDQEINISELLFGIKEEAIESGDVASGSPRFLPPDVPLGLHDGYVSVVKSPQDFYIQLAGTEDTLDQLSQELADLSQNTAIVGADNLCVGYACFAQYHEDESFYRAEVVSVQGESTSVLFVDYGNIDIVDKSEIKALTEKHLQLPPLAIKCKLNGIVPATEEWSEEAIKTFQDMVLDSCLGVTFISKDIPAAVNITKDDKEVAQCLVDMELANVESCTETDEAYAEDHLAPAPVEDPLSSLPNDQSYPQRKLSSTKHVVKICYVDNYDKFYVTPLELSTELDTIMTTLDILYASSDNPETKDSNCNVPDILEDPKVSMPCVAKYSEDGVWYRALITDIDGENIYVTFIDYGNSEITSLDNLRPLTPELLEIPAIALECSLFGIDAIPGKEQEITTKLEHYFVEELELEMEICEISPFKIKLLDTDNDIASVLINDGLAKEQCISVESGNFAVSSKITFVDESLEYKIQISKRFFSGADKFVGNVKFCETENDLVVFHVVPTDLEDDLQGLQQKLQDAYSEPSQNLTNAACLDFCATKYMEDENWYRAQVLSFDKDKVKVRFIDYGNCETVDKSNIYELLADFTIEPQFSVKCILFGLKVDNSKEVELQNRLDEYVYHEPVELKLCKHSHAACDLCITSIICGENDITELITSEMLVFPQYIINSLFDSVFKATIQKIQNNTVFLLLSGVVNEREAFQCKLQNVCKDLETLSDIQMNHLCAAKVDEIWYRVSVINISGCEVTVDLVDFGSTSVAKNSEFVPLPLDICHQPIFLQPCIVEDFGNLAGSAKISLEDLTVGYEISCKLQKTYPIVHPISIKILEIYSNLENNKMEHQSTEINGIDNSMNDSAGKKIIEIISESNNELELQVKVATEVNDEKNITDDNLEQTKSEDFIERNEIENSEQYLVNNEGNIYNSNNMEESGFAENEFENTKENKFFEKESDFVNKGYVICEQSESIPDEQNEVPKTNIEIKDIESGQTHDMLDGDKCHGSNDIGAFDDQQSMCETESRTMADINTHFQNPDEKKHLYLESIVVNEMTDVENYLEDNSNKNELDESECDAFKMTKAADVFDNNEYYETNDSGSFGDEKKLHEEQKNQFGNIDSIETNSNSTNDYEKLCNESNNMLSEITTEVEGNLEGCSNKKESAESECDASKMAEAADVLDDDDDDFYESNDSRSFEEDEKKIYEGQKNEFKNIDAIETKSIDDKEQLCNESDSMFSEIVTDVDGNLEDSLNENQLAESECGASKMAEAVDVLEEDEFYESNDSRSFEEDEKKNYEEQKNEFRNIDAVETSSKNFCDKEQLCDGSSSMLSVIVTDVKSNLKDYSSKNELAESVCDSFKMDHDDSVDSLKCCEDMRKLPREKNTVFENSSVSDNLTTSNITSEVACVMQDAPEEGLKCNTLNISHAAYLKETDTDLVDDTNESEKIYISSSSTENSINKLNESGVQSKNEEQEKTNLSSGCSNESDKFEIQNVFNSPENALNENNRGIEDSYQLSGSVQVKVSYLAMSDGSVIFAVQPLYLQDEFLLLKQSIQEFYSKHATSYNLSSQDNYCTVYHENEWYRGKILGEMIGDTSTILLIDYGDCISVDNSKIKNLDTEHSNVPPFAVWCTLSSVICPPEKSETAKSFLWDKLKTGNTVVKILDAGEPYKINLYVDDDSILNQLLKNRLVTQKLPNMYLESRPYKAKLSFLNINLETVEIFVRLVSFCDDYNALFESMQNAYKLDDFISNVVESGMYAAFYNDSWYRGLIVSSGNEVQVYLVDVGETIAECKNLCFLLPEHCFQPAFAIPCHIPFSDIQATTNEIVESINSILKAADFLVNINVCPDSDSISATLIDEQIVSEVKNIGLTCATECAESIKTVNVETEISASNDAKLSSVDSSMTAVVSEVQNIGLTCATECAESIKTDNVETEISASNNAKLPSVDSSMTAVEVVPYVEETFTTEPS